MKATRRAKDLVQQILAFSRQSEQELGPLDIGPIAKEILKLLRSSLPTTIEIRQNIGRCGVILGDPSQMHQILMNLCTNAGHAMREKGGVLEVRIEEVDLGSHDVLSYPSLNQGPHVRLTVSDTGHGISPDIIERVFEPFFTTKTTADGTGLGLSVVHGIVITHGGAINVYSEPGLGSTFEVLLPKS